MYVTEKMLREAGACEAVDKYFSDIGRKRWDAKKLLDYLIDNHEYKDAVYGLSLLMTKEQAVEWSIYCAESCLANFEREHPKDKRPREAIEAAKAYLAGELDESVARSAAESAARSAAWSAAESATKSARSAAWSAAESATKSASRSAVRSAGASAAWSAWSERSAAYIDLLNEGLDILLEGRKVNE